MLENIKEGMEYTADLTVGEKDTAEHYKSGGLKVFATPGMIALMESAAYMLLRQAPVGLESVGTEMNVRHTRACGPGARVLARAVVEKTDGKKVYFKVTAKDEKGEIGCGEHVRYIIDPEKFMSRL